MDCSLSAGGDAAVLPAGVFDLALGERASYVLTPLVANPGPDPTTVTSARIRVLNESGVPYVFDCTDPEGCGEWELDVEGEIAAGENGTFEVRVLPRVFTGFVQSQLDADVREGRAPESFRVQAEVQLIGRSAGEVVVGPPFLYEIEVCLGCLVEFPPGSDDPALPGPDCCGAGRSEPACYSGQDTAIDCRDCLRTLPEICNFGRTTCDF